MPRKNNEPDLSQASRPGQTGSLKVAVGNLKPLDGAPIRVGALRSATKAWFEEEIARWNRVALISLNLKASIRSDAGQVVHLDEHTARSEVKKFGNRVDRAVHGILVRRFNRRVPRVPFLEYGQDRGWHCHILMEVPAGMADVRFHQVVKEAWSSSPWSSDLDNRPGDDRAVGYLTKYRSKSEMEAWSDTIVVEAVFLRTK